MEQDKIPKIPVINQEIIDAINNRSLVVFIGAGVSRLAGCQGWNELAKSLISKCFDKNIISFKEMESLNLNSNSKKNITISYHLLEKAGYKDDFYDIMKKALKGDDTEKIYENITKLSGICVTTNADELFHNYFEKDRIIYKDFNEKSLSEKDSINILYQIHGMINDKESLTFKVKEYLDKYNDPNFQRFLKKIFNNYTVLFIGYGLEEFELLDYILTKAKNKKKHYMLYPAYKDEIKIIEYEKSYYQDLGIELLPYQKDQKGYNQLIDILSNWKDVIRYDSDKIGIGQEDIDRAISNVDISLLKQKLNHLEFKKHFYREILKKDKLDKRIIDFILDLNILILSDIPKCDENNRSDYWDQLMIFDNIISKNIEKLTKEQKDKMYNTIQKLIKEILNNKIKNFRSNEVILKLLLLLKDSELTLQEKNFFNYVLIDEGEEFLFGHYLNENILPRLIKNKNKILLKYIVKKCLGYKIINREIKSIIKEYDLENIFKNNLKIIYDIIGYDLIDNIKDIIKSGSLREKDYFDNYIIDDLLPIQDFNRYYNLYQKQLIMFFLDIINFTKNDQNKYRNLIKNLYEDNEVKIFKRISLHLISKNIKNYKTLIINDFSELLDKTYLKFELFTLLQENAKSFDENELINIVDILEKKLENKYKIKEWLEAFRVLNNKKINDLYEILSKEYPNEIKHPGKLFWYDDEDYIPKTPLTKESIQNLILNDDKIFFNTLTKYSSDISLFTKEASKEGLCNEIRTAVIDNHSLFSNNMKKFEDIDEEYYYFILSGFDHIIRTNNDINNFYQILSSINNRLKKLNIFSTDNKQHLLKYLIPSLLETSLSNLKFLEENELNLIFEILKYCIANLNNDIEKPNDAFSHLLNSLNGRYYYSLIKLLEISYKTKNIKIQKEILTIFEDKINKDININIAIASHLNFFMQLNSNWTDKLIDQLFNFSKNDFIWATIEAYLRINNTIYKEIFKKMEHVYNNLINNLKTFNNKDGEKALVDHLLIVYFNFDFDDSKINNLLKLNMDLDNIYLSILSFLSQRKDLDKIKSKKLWKQIAQNLNTSNNKNNFAINLFKSLINIGEIDKDIFLQLLDSVTYINTYPYNILRTFEYIIKGNEEYIIDILIKFTSKKIYFNSFEKELLNKILDQIPNNIKMNRLVNMYKEEGIVI